MKHVSVIVPEGPSVLSCIIGPMKVLTLANNYLKDTGKMNDNFFKVELVSLKKESLLYEGLFTIKAQKSPNQIKKTVLVIIPAIQGNPVDSVRMNEAYYPWIRKMNREGAEIASLCMGAFLLAETGLVDGKSCTTHWTGADLFREMYPEVRLMPEKIVTDENGIYTSGGAYSFLNLLLYMVEKFCGRECVLYCAKVFEVDMDRTSQSHFVMFQGQKDHGDPEIQKVQKFIEENVQEKISVEALAEHATLSKRNFIRRFKKATGNTPIEYIQRVKMEFAKKHFESSNYNINEVMYAVGYADSKAFRNIFRKVTGLSPVEYKNKYNRHLVAV